MGVGRPLTTRADTAVNVLHEVEMSASYQCDRSRAPRASKSALLTNLRKANAATSRLVVNARSKRHQPSRTKTHHSCILRVLSLRMLHLQRFSVRRSCCRAMRECRSSSLRLCQLPRRKQGLYKR